MSLLHQSSNPIVLLLCSESTTMRPQTNANALSNDHSSEEKQSKPKHLSDLTHQKRYPHLDHGLAFWSHHLKQDEKEKKGFKEWEHE